MAITNASKPSTSLANATRIGGAETWESIPTTWASETRTWLDCISLFDNVMKVAYGDPLWSASVLPWQISFPWQVNTGIMINQDKP